MKTKPTEQNVIGRTCIVRDTKHRPAGIVEAEVTGKNGDNQPTRIRLLTGEHAGEVRLTGEYQMLEWCEHAEAAGFIAAAWTD